PTISSALPVFPSETDLAAGAASPSDLATPPHSEQSPATEPSPPQSPASKSKKPLKPYRGPPEFDPAVFNRATRRSQKSNYKTRAERKAQNPLREEVPNPGYYYEDGLRKVKPYYFKYNTFCKERWRDKKLVEVFQTEFRDRPAEYYARAIAQGQVTINGTEKSTLDTVVRNGDYISHLLHRHEPPVKDSPIGIVYEDDRIMAINKPAGIPVHPAGRY